MENLIFILIIGGLLFFILRYQEAASKKAEAYLIATHRLRNESLRVKHIPAGEWKAKE